MVRRFALVTFGLVSMSACVAENKDGAAPSASPVVENPAAATAEPAMKLREVTPLAPTLTVAPGEYFIAENGWLRCFPTKEDKVTQPGTEELETNLRGITTRGEKVQVRGTKDGFCDVVDSRGGDGWVNCAELVGATNRGLATVLKETRVKADNGSEAGVLQPGRLIIVLDNMGAFVRVRGENNVEGIIATSEITTDPNEMAVAEYITRLLRNMELNTHPGVLERFGRIKKDHESTVLFNELMKIVPLDHQMAPQWGSPRTHPSDEGIPKDHPLAKDAPPHPTARTKY